jgi:hypothetical protein
MAPDRPPDPLTRLYRACDPGEELKGEDDPRYVNCDDVRGGNLIHRYERSLRLADPLKPEVKVFAGHRGVGKSSELKRLQKRLEREGPNGERPLYVLFVDVSGVLDLNDLDFPDLLVFLAAELQKQLGGQKIPGFEPRTQLLRQVWDRFKEALPNSMSLSGADLDLPFGSLAVELKNQPNARARLRREIEAQSTSLLLAVNDLLQLATVRLRDAGWEGLVLIVDGLDKLVRRELDNGSNTHDRLFLHRSEQLASLAAHVLYTVPISLIYSPQFTQLEQTFGEFHAPVPMIRLRESRDGGPPERDSETPGMLKLREILAARCRTAGVELAQVFDTPETCHHLCRMTGGHPRHLLMLFQAACLHVDALPVTRPAVAKAIANYGNSLLREVPDEFWPLLRKFDTPQEAVPHDELHQQMLLLLHLFEYMNGHPWYEVNPVLRGLPRFRE